ncbi:MAG: hypothetical protein ACSW8B_00060 [bacterium]
MNKDFILQNIIDDQDDFITVTKKDIFCAQPSYIFALARYVTISDQRVTGDTLQLCREMIGEDFLASFTDGELEEAFEGILMCDQPSKGFEFLKEIGALPPFLSDLITCHQRLDFHPEDTVWAHTMLVIDEAARVRFFTTWPEAFMWSALLHDIGKPMVTTPELHAHWHSEAGAIVFNSDVTFIRDEKKRYYIETMILYHMTLMTYQRHHAKPLVYRRFIKILDGCVPFDDLIMISKVDVRGRGLDNSIPIEDFEIYIDGLMERYGTKVEQPLVTRDDLLAIGYREDEDLQAALDLAYDYQIQDYAKEEILRRMQRE